MKSDERLHQSADEAPKHLFVDERMYACNSFMSENAHALFTARRISEIADVRAMGFFKQALRLVPGIQKEEPYKKWLAQHPKDMLESGKKAKRLSSGAIAYLWNIDDPAIHAVSRLEEIRTTSFSNIDKERGRLEEIFGMYDTLLTSIHGNTELPSVLLADYGDELIAA